MFFQSKNSRTGPLFKDSKILEPFDKTALDDCSFIGKPMNRLMLLSSTAVSNFFLSRTLLILDTQILNLKIASKLQNMTFSELYCFLSE